MLNPSRSHPLPEHIDLILIASTTEKGTTKMRFNLYQAEIERSNGWSKAHVVAPTEERAAELIFDHDEELRQEHLQFTLERVDEILPEDRRKGLDDMLETAAVGIASYSRVIGWVGHLAAIQQLKLFRIEDGEGSETFVIAPSKDIASALYLKDDPLAEGDHRLFRIFDGLADIPADRIASLELLLEFGPVGIARYGEDNGWSVK
ncbi:hypothetical protein [Parasphingorhabdus flavimaris]|uniref:hypothetical protein n=1 Tax=Parasphingorhabdus flavimaris TaxID=266812 RepID=UPI003003386A